MTINLSNFRHLVGYLLLGVFFFTMASFCHVRNAVGQDVSISDFTVSNSKTDLLLYLTVSNWLTSDMEAAINNGIPITFVFTIEIFADRPNWPDKKISEHEFNHIMEYDSLKKEYLIHRDEKGDSRATTSLEEARQLMSEISGFKVLPLNELDPQTSYTLRAKAKLARKTLPLYFHYLIPFSSPWYFETKWYELTLHLVL